MIISQAFAHLKWMWPAIREERLRLASYLIIAIYFGVIIYGAVTSPLNFPIVWLNYFLLIVLSGALIGPRFGVIMSCFLNLSLAGLSYFEYGTERALPLMATGTIIAAVAWITNKEIREERDRLEEKVLQRTEELRNLQIVRIAELHQAAENGKIAAGYFHDLMSPLTALSLAIQNLARQKVMDTEPLNHSLWEALAVSKKMQEFINLMRRQLERRQPKLFCANHEIKQIIDLLSYRAKRHGIEIKFEPNEEINCEGNILQFQQVTSNLVNNAIDALENLPKNNKTVTIKLEKEEGQLVLQVEDNGSGIPKKIKNKIFKNFVSSKTNGMGLGLAITKNIVEFEWGGAISFNTSETGTQFIVRAHYTSNFHLTP